MWNPVTHNITGKFSICKNVTTLVTSFTWSTKLKRKVEDKTILFTYDLSEDLTLYTFRAIDIHK